MGKIYKTSGGRTVDMEALARQNSKDIALGNMGVNAGGDKIGKGGKIVQTAQERVQEYNKEVSSTRDTVSVKGENTEEVTIDEKPNEDTKRVEKKKAKPNAKKNVEKELPDGSIEILDDPDSDEGNNL